MAAILIATASQVEVMRYLVFAFAAAIGLTGLFAAGVRGLRPRLLVCLCLYLGWLAAYGLFNYERFGYWAVDVCFFGTCGAAFAGQRRELLQPLIRAYTNMLGLSLLVSGPLLFLYLSPAAEGQRRTAEEFGFSNAETFMPSLFLLFFLRKGDGWSQWVVYLGLAMTTLFGIATASRGMAVFPVLALLVRVAAIRNDLKSVALRVVCGLAVVVVLSLSVWTSSQVDSSLGFLGQRFQKEDQGSGRFEETAAVLEELGGEEVLTGRGLGGSHHYSVTGLPMPAYGMNIVHFGSTHLILKGGIPLLGLVCVLYGAGLLRAFRSTDRVEKACGAWILVFVALNVGHTQFRLSGTLPFMWFALGRLLSPDLSGGVKPTRRAAKRMEV